MEGDCPDGDIASGPGDPSGIERLLHGLDFDGVRTHAFSLGMVIWSGRSSNAQETHSLE